MRRYLPFLLLLFLVAALLRVDFFFNIAYLFFLVYGLSRLWTRQTLRQMHVDRRFTTRAFAGDDVSVTVLLTNTGRLPVPWLYVHESLPIDLISPPFQREVFYLGAREKRSFGYELHCRKRGVYRLGPLHMETGDLLGIEPPRVSVTAPDHLVVYPQVVAVQRLRLPTRSPQVAMPAGAPLFEDPARVSGVRDYQRGDSPRRLHWTATAKAGRLLVKQYQPAIARATLLCLDLNAEAYALRERGEASELAIVAAASLANHILMRERLPVGLLTEARDGLLAARTQFYLPPRSERGHLMSILEALARVQLTQAMPLTALLRRYQPRMAWGSTIVAITGGENEELFAGLAVLRQAGFAVALVLVQNMAISAQAVRRAGILGVRVQRVWRARDLEQWH